MTSLLPEFAQFLLHILGWSLLHFLWQGTVIALLLAIALRLLSGKSAALRYGLASGALGLMALLPLVTFAWLAATTQRANASVSYPLAAQWFVAIPAAGLDRSPHLLLAEATAHLDRAMPWLLSAWIAGMTLFLVRLNIGLLVVRAMKGNGLRMPAAFEATFQDLQDRLGIARPVILLCSARVQVPTLIGWLRPAVLIPLGCFTALSPVQIEALLAHELAHVRRHDYLVNLLQSLLEAVLFYHPAVWWVSAQVRREREYCCDDLAAAISGHPLPYAKALASFEERRSFRPATTLGANGGALAMRIRRLLGHPETPTLPPFAAAALLALVVAAAGIAAYAHAQAADPALSPAQLRAEAQLPPLYRTWLDQDVRWIITPQERAQFLALPTNDERLQFIRQFWNRRNEEFPASHGMTFKQEHYRRIAYANVHFAADMPGWETDRGRIYILYGPPDSIDSHPLSGSQSAYELWHYRIVGNFQPGPAATTRGAFVTRENLDLRFVDTCHCGDYTLQTHPMP